MKRAKLYRDRLTQLAEWLEAGAPHKHIHFNMAKWVTLKNRQGEETYTTSEACGACCCMAGAAAQFFDPDGVRAQCMYDERLMFPANMCHVAQRALGLTELEAQALFAPYEYVMGRITPAQAAKTVRHLLATGRVDWSVSGAEKDL